MTLEEIKELMREFDASAIAELELETEETRLSLKKADACRPAAVPAPGFAAGPMPVPGMVMAGMPAPAAAAPGEMAPAAAVMAGEALPAAAAPRTSYTDVTAPLAGVFYRASSPKADPFVEEGQKVEKGETIGLIEAMKIINEVPAPCAGIVRTISAKNGDFTACGTVLMQIEEM